MNAVSTFTPVVRPDQQFDPRLFYVPAFEMRIEGAGLPENVLRDISEFTYRDSLTELDQFEITVNNWNADGRRFKFIGSESAADLTSAEPEKRLYRLFEPCGKEVTISMGYAGALVPMMIGNFTTMDCHFPNSGAPTLAVRGLNAFHRLRTNKYSTAWVGKSPSEIATNIGTLSDHGKPRFKWPIDIIKGTKSGEQPIPYFAQTSQYDIDFLLNLARQHGYELRLVGEGNNRRVEFGRASDAHRPVNYQLDWGRTLVDFAPTITTAGQFKSITVRGWDRAAQRPISEKVDFNGPELKRMNARFAKLVDQCDPQVDECVDLPVFSRADARQRAIALMRDNSARILRASGTAIGLPDLRAGTRVRIGNLGARISGDYLVTKTTHTIGEGGYTTKFECRLEDFKGAQA